jgi:predicted RNA-binding Zn ribbon-like protein
MENDSFEFRRLLLGGSLALDFCNTVDAHDSDHIEDCLHSYTDLVRWCVHAGAISTDQARTLVTRSQDHAAEAAKIFEHSREMRETIYQTFKSIAANTAIDSKTLSTFNLMLSKAMANSAIDIHEGDQDYHWAWRNQQQLDSLTWPIIRSAADLLTSPLRDRVRQCPNCGWLFVDQSRNRTRTWCDMRFCGNRVKARRHYERTRKEA